MSESQSTKKTADSTGIKPVSVEAYLDRIAYSGSLAPSLRNLQQIHLAHLQQVPFENFDIRLGRRIRLETVAILDKIVNRRRGGFCYELNCAFAWLLNEIGFKVGLLAASTYDRRRLSPKFDHMLLRVDFEQTFIADVAFGDSFLLPLSLDGACSYQFDRYYRLRGAGDRLTLQQQFERGDWQSQYLFDLKPQSLSNFEQRCDYHQTSEASPYTRKTLCTRATPEGRISLVDSRYFGEANDRQATGIESEFQFASVIRDRFGIDLADVDISRLFALLPPPDRV